MHTQHSNTTINDIHPVFRHDMSDSPAASLIDCPKLCGLKKNIL